MNINVLVNGKYQGDFTHLAHMYSMSSAYVWATQACDRCWTGMVLNSQHCPYSWLFKSVSPTYGAVIQSLMTNASIHTQTHTQMAPDQKCSSYF